VELQGLDAEVASNGGDWKVVIQMSVEGGLTWFGNRRKNGALLYEEKVPMCEATKTRN